MVKKRDMPSFLSQDRPAKVKEIYRALKRDHPGMPAAMKARIAARQGKPGKQKQGPPYKGPLTPYKEKTADLASVLTVLGIRAAGHTVRKAKKRSQKKKASVDIFGAEFPVPVRDHLEKVALIPKAVFQSPALRSLVGIAAPAAGGAAAGYLSAPTEYDKKRWALYGAGIGAGGKILLSKIHRTPAIIRNLQKATPAVQKEIAAVAKKLNKGMPLTFQEAALAKKYIGSSEAAKRLTEALAAGGAVAGGAHFMKSRGRRSGGGGAASVPFLYKAGAATRSEHWRKLKPGQSGTGPHGKKTEGKTWVDFDEKPGYARQMVRAAPAVAVKGLADIPKGAVEKKLEAKMLGKQMPTGKSLRAGAGRYVGGVTVGALTLPLFMAGVKKLKSKDPKQKAQGTALIVGSGVPYQFSKGYRERRALGGTRSQAAGQGLGRGLVSIPAAVGTALGIAKARGKKERGAMTTALYGALGGAAGGALKGAGEVPFELAIAKKLRGMPRKELLKRMAARGVSRGVAGGLGGAAFGALFDWMAKAVK